YGGTAVWTARSAVEADYKTVRYSGKERDATGLYYYGYRYYQPWAGRWLSSDPAGTVDGLNLYRMVRNNPVTLIDSNGLYPDTQKAGYVNQADKIWLLTEALKSQGKDFFQRKLTPNIEEEERNAAPERSGWDPKDLKHRLNISRNLFNQVNNTDQKRYFIGRMGNEREKIISDNRQRHGVLNSNVWSPVLNDAFIYGGINIGATFYLWNKLMPRELELISKKEKVPHINLEELIRKEPSDVNLPVLMRSPGTKSSPAHPSVTAREIELLLNNNYKMLIIKEKNINLYKSSESERSQFEYRFVPSMQKRQILSVEKHISRHLNSKRHSVGTHI
ncbi:RHS repeat-associated core domain-containing protein, partial [Pantoea agglomerans]|uniref:RHS repeat-associated core domain-containing protein n=1 Tax=Enterobacter agglomerans TaxID=549 RepID=UPI001EE82E24